MREIGRRSFLGAMGSLAALASGSAVAFTPRHFFEKMYTLGADAGHDLDASFGRLAEIGYREVELPNLLGHNAREVKAAATRAGVAITSLHLPLLAQGGSFLSLASEAGRIVDTLGELGARWVAAPILLIPDGMRPQPKEGFGSAIARAVAAAGPDIWKRTAALLNQKGEALKPLGVSLAYHNHNLEFAPVDGTTGWDILWRETDPSFVHFELDTGWIATAGLDPVRFLKTCSGRVALLHIKDVAAGNQRNFTITMTPAEVGSGILKWDKILPAAYDAGVRHCYVEQEPPFVIPRMEAASFALLSKLF